MIKEVKKLNKKEKEFIYNNEYSHFNQDIKYNEIRNEKNKHYLISEKNGKLIWMCNLLEKEKDIGKVIYAPRGPILNFENEKDIETFFDEIHSWMKERGYKYLEINPCISKNMLNNFPDKLKYKLIDRTDYDNLFDACKLAIVNVEMSEKEMFYKLSQNCRRNTKKAYNNNLKVKITDKTDLINFYKLYLDTANKHNFKPHTMNYFKKLIKIYKCDLVFIEVWQNDIPLAMAIDITFKDSLIYFYGASSKNKKELRGMYMLHWEAIKYCIKNKIKKYDLGGVFCEDNDTTNKDFGLYNFKKGYCKKGFIDIISDILIEI